MRGTAAIRPTPLDVVVRQAMTQKVDPVTRAGLVELETVIRNADLAQDGIDPPSLVGMVFAAIMPRLTNPGVLDAGRRRRLLERIEARAAAQAPGDAVVPGGILALRQELENLRMLRQNQDSLIGA